MKVGFAGTPEFAALALESVLAAGFEVPLVLTQPDRPAGRGMKLSASPVKQLAMARNIEFLQPRSLRLEGKYPEDAAATKGVLEDLRPDVIVVAAYGLILPQWVLGLPTLGCLNIHASLLPRWRGAAPIHRAIEAGDAHTGVTIMQMDAGLDTGDMLLVEKVEIGPDETTASLHDRLATLGGRLIVEALDLAACGALTRTPQPSDGVTYAHKIEKTEALVDWTLPSDLIERRMRAFDPFPGASSRLGKELVKLWRGRAVPGIGEPGVVLAITDERLVIACGVGALSVAELQRPGGKRVSARQFLQGHPLRVGERFSVAPG